MNKAIRIAITAAFGVAATLPAFADFENAGPSDQQGRHIISSLSEVNPPALDGSFPALTNNRSDTRSNADRYNDDRMYRADADRYSDGRIYRSDANQYGSDRQFRSDREYTADNSTHEGRFHRFFHRDSRAPGPDNQVYGGVSEPGNFSEPGMRAGEFNWDHYTMAPSDNRYYGYNRSGS